MTDYKNIILEKVDAVVRITLNRPPLNVLNIGAMKEITAALDGLVNDNTIKMVVFLANGKAFSAGVDVSEHMGNQAAEMIKSFHDIFRAMIKLNKPTLAVVNGSAIGGGCELVTFCDFIIASETSKFGQPEIQVGVLPPIACIIFPKIISQKKALELLLSGALIAAPEAEQIGLINKSVPVDKLDEEAAKFINKFTGLSSVVLAHTRQAALGRFNKEFLDYLAEVEDNYLNKLMKTEDANEGLKAFLEKRKPEWKNK
jgi:cyclohexa-1,5-dienecarbonyl-CoA hydratase